MNRFEPLIEVRNLYLNRGNFQLTDVSFSVEPNEILAIIGKTGSGKTLLLESIAGFHEAEKGHVYLRGKAIEDYPLAQREIGYLYQEYCLFPHMTARNNIAYGLKMKKVSRKETAARVENIAREFEIESVLEQYPATLSGGEQQRVALARALITEPDLLLLDEPFSALDPVTKKKMYDMIQKIHKDFSCAIVFVTHDFYEAMTFADRIGVLMNGRLRGITEGKQLFYAEWEKDVRQFLGLEK